MSDQTGVRAGILGYGLAGRHFHALIMAAAGLEVAAVATSRVEQLAEDFPNAAALSIDEVFARADLDLVVVATPHRFHAEHARKALEAGKHVVVDKPFAASSAEAMDLARLAKSKGLVLSVFQNRRWDADYLTLKRLIAEDVLGEVIHYSERWDRFRPVARGGWRSDDHGGELFELGPHLVDHALDLFGAPDWLMADVFNQRGVTNDNDGFEIVMGKGRARITLGVGMLAADGLKGFRVLGTKAAFVKEGLDPQEPQMRLGMAVSDAHFGREPESQYGRLFEPDAAPVIVPSERGDFRLYYRAVAEAIRTGAAPPVTAEEGARVIAVLEAAQESSNSGKRLDMAAFLAARGL